MSSSLHTHTKGLGTKRSRGSLILGVSAPTVTSPFRLILCATLTLQASAAEATGVHI